MTPKELIIEWIQNNEKKMFIEYLGTRGSWLVRSLNELEYKKSGKSYSITAHLSDGKTTFAIKDSTRLQVTTETILSPTQKKLPPYRVENITDPLKDHFDHDLEVGDYVIIFSSSSYYGRYGKIEVGELVKATRNISNRHGHETSLKATVKMKQSEDYKKTRSFGTKKGDRKIKDLVRMHPEDKLLYILKGK